MELKEYSFDQIAQLAQDKERHHIELKNSSFVVLSHPYHSKDGKQIDKSTFTTKTKQMLARECGAFANSNGGILVIGFNDNGTLDEVSAPEVFEESTTLTSKWLEDLLQDSLEPPIEKFNCNYLKSDLEKGIVVIQIPVSEKAPHQCIFDKRYYIRQGTSVIPADHWVIEMIRNRRIHPKLQASINIPQSFFYLVNDVVGLNLSVEITNESGIMATHWAFRVDCPHASEARVLPETEFPPLRLPRGTKNNVYMVKALNPVFPTQIVQIPIRLLIPCDLDIDSEKKSLTRFRWLGLSDKLPDAGFITPDGMAQDFYVNLSVFADNASPTTFKLSINNIEWWPKMIELLQKEGRLAR